MPDAAEAYFEQFLDGEQAKLSRIMQAIADSEPEGLMLDYKRNADNRGVSVVKPTDGSSHHLGRIMSAFANTNGGLILWGIDAKEGKPVKGDPIPDINVFVQHINTLTAGATEPVIKGVRTVGVADGAGTSGFAVTYVPRSHEAPHQALRGPHHNYWMRNGSNCVVMEHRFVSALFAERARPNLLVAVGAPKHGKSPIGEYAIVVAVAIQNQGEAIARFPALIYESIKGVSIVGPSSTKIATVPCFTKSIDGRQAIIQDKLLYPGTTTVVCYFQLVYKGSREKLKPFTIRIFALCEGFSGQETSFEITEAMLLKAAGSNLAGDVEL